MWPLPITKRLHNMALNEFLAWFQRAPRAWFHQGYCIPAKLGATGVFRSCSPYMRSTGT